MLNANAASVDGAFTLSSTPAEVQSSVNAGIDASTRDLPRVAQGSARSKLAEIPEICRTYTFRLDQAALSWQCDAQAPLVIPRASFGAPVPLARDGKRVTATVSLTGDVVAARFVGDQGERTISFTFSEAGLVARAAVQGEQLTVPMAWTVRYARQAVPAP
jgi:hypothetical protein